MLQLLIALALTLMAAATSERSYDATRKADSRAAERDLLIPDVVDSERRRLCEADDERWLRTYCADVFYNPFTRHQQTIIKDCAEALQYGTQKCKAAPRGDGKSSIVKYLALKYALRRQVKFPLIVAATSSKAKKILGSQKRRLSSAMSFDARKKRFLPRSPIGEDYPLECSIACYVDPWPSRGRNITANGFRPIHIEWGAEHFILPTWEGEEPLGPIIYALGITSDDLQGCNIYDVRPDFVMLDDLDSRDSLAAEDGVVAGKIEEAIDKTIAGLGAQSRRLGQFMLCTITSRDAAAFKYSDPKIKPAWSGERIAAIVKWPARKDMWDKFVELRNQGKSTLDEAGRPVDVFGRAAHQWYLDNYEAMNEGAELSNPFNFEADLLPDGSQKHASSLERCYEYIADKGMDSFLTEHQNDPPEAEKAEVSNITSALVASRVNGLEHKEIHVATSVIVSFLDLGATICNYTDSAWSSDCVGRIADYGMLQVNAENIALEKALMILLHQWRLSLLGKYKDSSGQTREIDLALIDSGNWATTVYDFCKEVGPPFYPSKGMKDYWKPPTQCIKRGDNWALVKQPNGVAIYEFNATHYKKFCHQRFITPTLNENNQPNPGSLSLFVCPDAKQFRDGRREYCHQIVGEIWGAKKPGAAPGWILSGHNHYLDATAGNCLAANIRGVVLFGTAQQRKKVLIPSHMRRA